MSSALFTIPYIKPADWTSIPNNAILDRFFISYDLFFNNSQIIKKLNMIAKYGSVSITKPHQIPIKTNKISFHLGNTLLLKNHFFIITKVKEII